MNNKVTYLAVVAAGRIVAWDIFNGWSRIASVRTRREARTITRLINA